MTLHTILVSLLLVTLLGTAAESQRPDEGRIVTYAKDIDVSKLEPGLVPQRLEDWITRVTSAPAEKIIWRMTGCDLKPKVPPQEHPLCADFIVPLKIVSIRGSISIGTNQKGIVEEPKLRLVLLFKYEKEKTLWTDFKSTEKLSDVPSILAQFRR